MGVVASQLIAKVSTEGVDAAKGQLKGMGEAVSNTGDIFKTGLGGALSFASGLAGTALNFFKDQMFDSVKVAMQQQDVMAQTAQAIKSTGDASGMTSKSLIDLADQLSTTTPFAKGLTESGENLLLTFTGIGKDVFPQTTKIMDDMAQAMHTGPTQEAMLLGKALNDPAQGLSALTRVGVTFSDQEKEQIKTMMAHHDVMGAQKVMLKELSTEFGGSATAAGKTFGGQMQILGNQFEDVKEKVGMAVLPILQQFMGFISGSAMPVLDKFGTWFSADAVPVLQQFGNTLQQNVGPTLQNVATYLQSPAFASFASGVGQNIAIAFKNIGSFAKNDVEPAVKNVAAFLGSPGFASFSSGVGHNIATIFQQIGNFAKNDVAPAVQNVAKFLESPGFQSFAGGVGHGIQEVFSGIGNVGKQLAPVFQQIGAELAKNFVPAWQQLQPILKNAIPPLQTVGQIIGGVLLVAIGLLVAGITGLARGIAGAIGGIITIIGGLVSIFSGVFNIIGGIISFFVDLFTLKWSNLGNDIMRIVGGWIQIFQGIWGVITGLFQTAIGFIGGFISGFVDGIVGFFKGLYDTLVGHSIIPDMIDGIINWFQQLPGRVGAFIMALINGAINNFNALKNEAIVLISTMISGIIGFFQGLPDKAMNFVNNLVSSIKNTLGGLGSKALGWASDMISGFVQGIQNGLADVGKGASDIANKIKSYLHFTKPDVGPLADVDTWMPDFGDMISSGLNAQIGKVHGASLNIASSLSLAGGPIIPQGARVVPAGQTAQMLNQQPQASNQPIYLQIDGHTFARLFMPYMVGQVRNQVGIWGM